MTNRNLSELIERSFPEDRLDLLRLLAAQAETRQMPLYIVGGSVRDLLLGRRLNDFDFIVEGDAIALGARSLPNTVVQSLLIQNLEPRNGSCLKA